jgi:hypothetical protein
MVQQIETVEMLQARVLEEVVLEITMRLQDKNLLLEAMVVQV